MNPSNSQSNNNISPENLLERAFENNIFAQNAPVPDTEAVTHSESDKQAIKDSWAEFYSLKTETITAPTPESPVERIQLVETKVEVQVEQSPRNVEREEKQVDSKPTYVVEDQKGSGSWLEDAGFKLDFKSLFKGIFNLFGGIVKDTWKSLNIVKEITMDTVTLVVGKKEKKADKPMTEAEAKRKAEAQKRKGNIRAFYDGLKAQMGSVATIEAVRVESQEKENINKTIKLTNTSYKGIKDNFGRLTIYAASMFEKEQLEQEKVYKKMEKQQKAASTGPDLNLDKAAEGGFLSSTGGQGAG